MEILLFKPKLFFIVFCFLRNLGILSNYRGFKIILFAVLNFITDGILIIVKAETNFCFLCSGGWGNKF